VPIERSQLLARWPGIYSQILSEIQQAAQTVLGVYLKRTCSRITSASSTLGVLNDYALYKSMHSNTQTDTHRPQNVRDQQQETVSMLCSVTTTSQGSNKHLSVTCITPLSWLVHCVSVKRNKNSPFPWGIRAPT